MKRLCRFLSILTFFVGAVLAEGDSFTLQVKHDHFFGSGTGELTVSAEGIVYHSEDDEKHSREWAFTDIQEVKIVSPTKLEILTYEDVRWKLNQDRRFSFEMTDSEIQPDLVRFLRQSLATPMISAVFAPPEDVFYMVPVKHRHSLGGGCDGELLFGERGMYYHALSHPKHSREWPLQAIESIGRMSPFSFRITVPEESATGGERNFQFELKRPMDEEAYQLVWRQIYEPESWLTRLAASWEEEPE